ncbi:MULTISPECIES: HAD family hydrolase [unclassified Sedimentibacter]|uniref:HAD family hydrolase n=1 Tax=unclassified Sedimentibacter TaxID=2649220 RepID=UPI0027E0CDD8|nr:HAD family hydrolase [Sedimentibacter sp. MB35-C1]WMJ75793.1 HAD family hydrolase [Sedimentibacter sp. MB35-C1]
MKYKMVVLDLDGTLLNNDKHISLNNIEILNDLHGRGIKIVIATGRNYYMAKTLVKDVENVEPVILANNGAIIRKSQNDELIECNYLSPLEFEKIYREGIKRNLNPVLHVDEYFNGYDLIYENENFEEVYRGYIKKGYERAKLKKFNPLEIKNILSVCYFNDYNMLCDFSDEMNKINRGNYNTICNRNIGKRALLEFLHPDGCKWSALKKYALQHNVGPDEIVSIGDDNNDIELLKNSGLGIAMLNGTEESKKAAKIITTHNNNDSGVYHILNEIFKM